jgi:hypothetical protein
MRTTDDFVASESARPISRRSVLRAGAHAAWMVPAVQVVSAVPAFAACSKPLRGAAFSFTGTAVWSEQSTKKWVLTLTYTITSKTPCPVTGMSLVLTAPSSWGGIQDHSTPVRYNATKVGGGYANNSLSDTWSFTPVQTSDTTWQVVMKIQASDSARHAGTLTLVASAGGYSEPFAVTVKAK